MLLYTTASKPMGPADSKEDTISLLPRLAVLYPDEVIAGILNRQGRKTATGGALYGQPSRQSAPLSQHSPLPIAGRPHRKENWATIRKAAQILGLNTSTIHRWLADGFIAGEQVTPGAPWQIRITDELRARIVEASPTGLSADAGSYHQTRGFTADGVATCKAWRGW